MSLLVAKLERDNLFIVSDTKLTYPENQDSKTVSNPKDGVVKVSILNPNIFIAFAGDVEAADKAIAECRTKGFDLIELINYLHSVHLGANKEVEFIIGSAYKGTKNNLVLIKDGITEKNLLSCWIGSRDGFSFFQKAFQELKEKKKNAPFDMQSLTEDALIQVCESAIVPEVNGFVITVASKMGQFEYIQSVRSYIASQTFQGSGPFVIGHSTAQQGGYTVSTFGDAARYTTLPIFVLQGKFGIVYTPKNNGAMYPKVFSNIFEYEFFDLVKYKYGIVAPFSISSPQRDCYYKAVEEANKREWSTALDAIRRGMQVDEQHHKAELTLVKGMIYCQINKGKEGILLLQEAARMKPKMHPEVMRFLAWLRTRH
jgi:hypothetical protein